MVYCGKPSRACHACRERKTRCDAKIEGCTQCKKAKRVCPGYRVQVDLLFRDQSKHVIQKAKARQAKRDSQSSPKQESSKLNQAKDGDSDDDLEIVQQQNLGEIFSINPTVEDAAMCYFVSNFGIGVHVPGQGFVDNLAFFYGSEPVDQAFMTSVNAVGLASYAHYTQSSSLLNTAQYQYTQAVSLTNAALTSPADAVKDGTLMSITVLGVYELLTGSNQRSLQAWSQHVQGAATLVKLRGHKQFMTPTGRRLFVQVLEELLTNCLQQGIRLPDHIVEMFQLLCAVAPMTDGVRAAVDVNLAILEFTQLRADWLNCSISDPHVILAESLKIDERFEAFHQHPPSAWHFDTITSECADPDLVFRNFYHLYRDSHTGNIWNGIRVVRSLLHSKVREVLLQGFSTKPPIFTKEEHTRQLQRSTDICYDMQSEILASVPHLLGFIKQQTPYQAYQPLRSLISPSFERKAAMDSEAIYTDSTNALNQKRVFPNGVAQSSVLQPQNDSPQSIRTHIITPTPDTRASNCYTLIWQIFAAGDIDTATNEIRTYCASMLRRIGSNMGIRHAIMLAKSLEIRIDP